MDQGKGQTLGRSLTGNRHLRDAPLVVAKTMLLFCLVSGVCVWCGYDANENDENS
jgi:hypothetical protein